jgi:hypothetical protein
MKNYKYKVTYSDKFIEQPSFDLTIVKMGEIHTHENTIRLLFLQNREN